MYFRWLKGLDELKLTDKEIELMSDSKADKKASGKETKSENNHVVWKAKSRHHYSLCLYWFQSDSPVLLTNNLQQILLIIY